MNARRRVHAQALAALALVALVPALAACAGDAAPADPAAAVPSSAARDTGTAPAAGVPVAAATQAAGPPKVLVHKSPSCGCCGLWVEHLRDAGFEVEIRDHAPDALNRIKLGLGVPHGKGSCHTAEVGGYFVEGHVPAADIRRLLAEAPDAKGLVLPGMPLGSPGMEVPDGTVQPYVVERVDADGGTVPFASH